MTLFAIRRTDNHSKSREKKITSQVLSDDRSTTKEGIAMDEAMALHGGFDLHGDNVFCTLMNKRREVVFERRFANNMDEISHALEPFRKRIVDLAVESTYNWYWLVDGLQKLKYMVRLANPAKMQENIGLKYADDKSDSRFVARQLTMGTLPEGYIYPKEERGIRDILRRRMRLSQARTGEWLSLESLVARHTGRDMNIAELSACDIEKVLEGDEHAIVMAQANLRHIEFLKKEIAALEKAVKEDISEEGKRLLKHLMTVPGIGPVLGRVIVLETGPVSRFKGAGNYASYCRAVSTEHISNSKKKGEGNGKSGNKYLAWAYVEAANFAVRYSPELRAWFQRKQARSGKRVIAIKAMANKMAKACYFMMRDGVDFDVKRMVG
jgi:transposase